MKLFSKYFNSNQLVDKQFSFRGGKISPHLKWENFSINTKLFALTCNDPEVPIGDWIHWYVINLPNNITEISLGGTILGEELQNDYG